jgi:hypothetical protein
MDRKKCRGIIKKESRLLILQLVKVLEEEIARDTKVVGQEKYTWWISITFKRTVYRISC